MLRKASVCILTVIIAVNSSLFPKEVALGSKDSKDVPVINETIKLATSYDDLTHNVLYNHIKGSETVIKSNNSDYSYGDKNMEIQNAATVQTPKSGKEEMLTAPSVVIESKSGENSKSSKLYTELNVSVAPLQFKVIQEVEPDKSASPEPPSYIKNIRSYEGQFSKNGYNGDDSDEKSYKTIKGSIPILLSAPHAVKQYRNGAIKAQDTYTGSIVKILQEKLGCHVIFKTYNDNTDANYDIDSKFKDEMVKIIKENNIKLVLDIHGAAADNPFDIELGTDSGRNLLSHTEIKDITKNIFQQNGISNVYVDNYFKASTRGTIAKYISTNVKIPAMQIEINRIYRSPDTESQNFIQLIDSLTKIITELNKKV